MGSAVVTQVRVLEVDHLGLVPKDESKEKRIEKVFGKTELGKTELGKKNHDQK